jgi:hypothetical protein
MLTNIRPIPNFLENGIAFGLASQLTADPLKGTNDPCISEAAVEFAPS